VIRLYGLFFLVDLTLLVVALIDCLSTDEHAVRNLPKVAWVLLILLFSPIGAIVWFVAGRPQNHHVGRAGDWRPGDGFPEYDRPRPTAPDDDPDFMRNMTRARRADEEMFAKWEADLRRREEQLRRENGEKDNTD
jgi:membrane-associated phospholipid phosphatase